MSDPIAKGVSGGSTPGVAGGEGGETPIIGTGQPEAPKTSSAPLQSEMIAGGREVLVTLPPKLQQEVLDRIKDYQRTAQFLTGPARENPQTVLDKFVAESLADWEANPEHMQSAEFRAIGQLVLTHELLNRTLAVAKIVRQQNIDWGGKNDQLPAGWKRWGLLRQFVEMPQTEFDQITSQMTTEYMREIGIGSWDPKRIEENLKSLNGLRLDLEQSLFPQTQSKWQERFNPLRGFRNPLWEQIDTGVHPLSFGSKTGENFHDKIVDRFVDNLKGKSPGQVWKENPLSYMNALYQAEQSAISDIMDKRGLEILKKAQFSGENHERIEARASQLESKLPEGEEAVTPELINAKATEIAGINQRIKTLTDSRTGYQNQITEREGKSKEVEKKIAETQRSITKLTKEISDKKRAASAFGKTVDRYVKKVKADQAKSSDVAAWSQTQKSTDAVISGYVDKRQALETNLGTLRGQKAEADQKATQLHTQLDQVITDFDQQIAAELAELNLVKPEYQSLLAKARLQKEAKTPEDRKKKALAMRKWDAVVNQEQSAVMEKVYNPNKNPEFTRDKLTSIRIVNGRVEGAERIRQLLLGTLTAGKLEGTAKTEYLKRFAYDLEKHQGLLSEHYLARAIAQYLNLPRIVRDPNGNPLDIQAVETTINGLQQQLDNTPVKHVNVRANLQQQIQNQSNILLQAVLPELDRSAFEMGDFLSSVILDRYQASAEGDPFRITPYQQPEARYEVGVESALQRGVGRTTITQKDSQGKVTQLSWQSENQRVNTRIYDAHKLEVAIDIKANQDLINRMPPTMAQALAGIAQFWPGAAVTHFYDNFGHLRREAADNRWIRIKNQAPSDFDTFLGTANLDPDMVRQFPIATANTLLETTQNERQTLFRGFRTQVATINIPGIGGQNIEIKMEDDGRLTLQNITAGNPPEEFSHTLQNDFNAFLKAVGVQQPTPQMLENYQNTVLRPIMDMVGREALQALQSR